MILLIRGSYLSVVADRNDPGRLIVRARRRGDIERIFPSAWVIARPSTQFRYRAFLDRASVEQILGSVVVGMTSDDPIWAEDQAETAFPYREIDAVMKRAQADEPFPFAVGDFLPAIRSDGSEVKPLPEPLLWVPAEIKLSAAQFAQVRLGMVPRQMEDKWFLFFEDPWLYCVRSWTGAYPYAVRFESKEQGARITGVLVSMNPDVGKWKTAEEAAELAIETVKLNLLGIWPDESRDSLALWAAHGRAIVGEAPPLGVEYRPEKAP